MEPQLVPLPRWTGDFAIKEQFRKTAMCNIFARRGSCRDNCPFAHTPEQLRARPQLEKTAMCRAWAWGRCPEQDCKYAHGIS